MDKSKQKQNKSYNSTAIIALVKKYGMSQQYIRRCIKGDYKSISADIIKSDYTQLVVKIEKLIKNQ